MAVSLMALRLRNLRIEHRTAQAASVQCSLNSGKHPRSIPAARMMEMAMTGSMAVQQEDGCVAVEAMVLGQRLLCLEGHV